MRLGIEKIDLYASGFCMDALALAQARGRTPEYAKQRVMLGTRSVLPPFEDSVTLAVNACKRLLAGQDVKDIALVIVGTESAVDHGKPVSTWVHRFLELPQNVRCFEVKHACYSATAGFKMALAMLATLPPGKKALVVSADYSKPGLRDNGGYDFIGGAVGVAMLVSATPRVLEVELDRAGYWCNEIADTFRPTSRSEVIDNETSIYSYLDALEGAYTHFTSAVGDCDFARDFKFHIYHTPFPGMALEAHRVLHGLAAPAGGSDKAAMMASFEEKVAPTLTFARQLGTAYGASNFVSLLSLLSGQRAASGDRLSIFSYGSGCQGEFYEARVGVEGVAEVQARRIQEHLGHRRTLSLEQYEHFERLREEGLDQSDWDPMRGLTPDSYEPYAGKGLLVLKKVEAHRRLYEWS